MLTCVYLLVCNWAHKYKIDLHYPPLTHTPPIVHVFTAYTARIQQKETYKHTLLGNLMSFFDEEDEESAKMEVRNVCKSVYVSVCV
jgi:hypothetical protein